MYTLINGKETADKLRNKIALNVERYKNEYNAVPGIAVILVGENPASQVYVASKERATIEAGMHSIVDRLPESITEEALLATIAKYNADPKINGILVQLPLPKHIDEMKVTLAIDHRKDVDGFHPINIGLLSMGEPMFAPCTPYGIMQLLKEYNISPEGKHAVIVGRSNIVGKPMASLLLSANATVTIVHSKTKNIKELCKQADILIVAVGRAKMIDASYVKSGAVVIDVGINRIDGKLYGDVDFDNVCEVTSAITPVPKGVGPMTIAMLIQNTFDAFSRTIHAKG